MSCTNHPKKSKYEGLVIQENCLECEKVISNIYSFLEDKSPKLRFCAYYLLHEAPRGDKSSLSSQDFKTNLVEDVVQVVELSTTMEITDKIESQLEEITSKFLVPNREELGEIGGYFVQKAHKHEICEDGYFEAYILTQKKNLTPNDDGIDIVDCAGSLILGECKLNLSGDHQKKKASSQLEDLESCGDEIQEYGLKYKTLIVDFSLREKRHTREDLRKSPDEVDTLFTFLNEMNAGEKRTL